MRRRNCDQECAPFSTVEMNVARIILMPGGSLRSCKVIFERILVDPPHFLSAQTNVRSRLYLMW